MAGRGYGGRRESWRERGSSIFSDDDDDRRGRGTTREEDRGFFERAGDEVRSWFGDEEAERRRERDMRRDEVRSAFGSDEARDPRRGGGWTGSGRSGGWESSGARDRPIFKRDTLSAGGEKFSRDEDEFGAGRSGRGSGLGGSQWDDNYLRWRALQIEQFDREYDDYCRERQHRFDQEFDTWRTSRLTRGGTAGSPRGAGDVDVTAASGDAGAAARSLGTESAVASSDLGGTAAGTRAGSSATTRGRGRTGS